VDIIGTLVIGGIVGWLASILMKTNAQMGIIANVAVGVVGSVLGRWIGGLLGFAAVGFVAKAVVAVGGAAVLIAVLKGMKVLK
jgi:uncharacterized membrane protein YeaQ/YmgE (transglycosylase-associated protein family)